MTEKKILAIIAGFIGVILFLGLSFRVEAQTSSFSPFFLQLMGGVSTTTNIKPKVSTWLFDMPYGSSTSGSFLDTLFIGRTSTTTINGDGGISTFRDDIIVSGNATTSGFFNIGQLLDVDGVGTSTFAGDVDIDGFLNVDNGASLAVSLSDTGPVSIGSTLDVTGLSTFTGFISSASSTVSAPFHVSDVLTSSSSIAVDGTSLFALTGGNVGIGTAGPTAKFEVDGFGDVISSVNNISQVARFGKAGGVTNMGIVFDTDAEAGTAALRGFNISHASQDFHIVKYDSAGVASPTFDFTVGASGKVAVGDDSPDFVFEIASSTTSYDYFGVSGASDGSIFTITNTGNVGIGTTTPSAALSVTGTGEYVMYVNDETTDATPFVIDGSGNVGIGKSNPTRNLEVEGTDGIEIAITTTDAQTNSVAQLLAFSDNTNLSLNSHSSGRTLSRFGITLGGWGEVLSANNTGSTNGLIIGVSPAKPLVFGTNNLERMRIDENGNVGIGTTSPVSLFSIQSSSGSTTLTKGASNRPTQETWYSPAGNPFCVYLNDAGTFLSQAGQCN